MTVIGLDPPRAPLIGRLNELAHLEAALRRADQGSPATVLISGEAGVGKSRLLREFAGPVAGKGARVLVGACVDLGGGDLPYAPLVDALRTLVRDVGADTVRELAGPAYPALARLAPFLGNHLDPAAPDQNARSQMFEGVLRMLDRLGADAPVVMIVEDLHWADRSTLDLLDFLVRAVTRERLLLVASYRSSDLWPGHPLRSVLAELERTRRAERLELAEFTIDELRTFLTALLGSAPGTNQVERLYELSDGNAFFVEELIVAGAHQPVAKPDRPAIPQPLRDVIITRVEVLGKSAQRVLRLAAVAGRYVGHRLLAAACELSERTLLSALRKCVDHHLLAARPNDDAYAFRHALAREAVYEDLLPGERMRLHAAVATVLDRDHSLAYTTGRSVATELAHHWFLASDTPRALAASVLAGRDASEVCAFAEAERQYSRALTLWSRAPEPERLAGMSYVQLLGRAAEAAWWAGHPEQAIERTCEALGEVESEHRVERAALFERLGRYRWESGDAEGTHRAYARADELLHPDPPSPLRARVRAARAMALVSSGDHALGLRLGTEAVDMARTVGATAEEGLALSTTGLALVVTGRPDDAIAALRRSVEIARACGHLEDLHRAYAGLVFALEGTGRTAEALDVASAAVEHGRTQGLPVIGGGLLLAHVAILLMELGRWDEAVRVALEALERDMPFRSATFLCLVLAEVAVHRGRFDDAEQRLATCRETIPRMEAPHATASLHTCVAQLAIWRRRYEQASRSIAEGLAALTDLHDDVQTLRLCALGARVQADEAERQAALGTRVATDVSPTITALGVAVARVIGSVDSGGLRPEAAVERLQCTAELTRLDANGSALWGEVAAGWLALERPYPAAYARWRQAEALVAAGHDAATAAAALRQAYATAVDLGAEPLREEIDALARRTRIVLAEVAQPVEVPDPFHLTRREYQVLDLLCEGRTNRQIARELFITERTASVHVSNILTKLGVTNRGEAAAVAYRLDLVRDSGGRVSRPGGRSG
jgi:ATP/maltotriose-dependent transcriptional regulator MalT